MPMHILMTDLIESQGGSSVLIRLLNRLVVSADNLDFLHSFARVFCGNQKSSWHGTTYSLCHHCLCLKEETSLSCTHWCTHCSHSGAQTAGGDFTVSHTSAYSGAHTAHTSAHSGAGGDFTVSDTSAHTAQTSAHSGAHTAHTSAHSGAQTAGGDFTVSYTSAHSGAGGHFTVSDTSAHSGAHTAHTSAHTNIGGIPDYLSSSSFQISRKKTKQSSPFPSPSRLTRSPMLKAQKRLRTGTEGRMLHAKAPIELPVPTYQHRCHATVLNLSDFVPNSNESQSQHDLQCEMNVDVAYRVALYSSGLKYPFLGLQGFYALI